MLGTAIALTSKNFEGVFDKGGRPYILHSLQVMYWVDQSDDEIMQIAVMHDLIEDTDVTLNDLEVLGFSPRVLNALSCVTHADGEPYDDYIDRILTNEDAIQVKIADIPASPL